ncbi:hypothetical protein CWC38_05605 [Kocuria tytonicola]|uniref:Uncharacterized protein n=1 Tax=Kocuria tytonicola TaxID=2055946 RepID=A0A3L9L8K8_9MICC|nr:hypothetical protein [Kocuria tytonicola]RLY94891.1 hypothetical protein EAE32_07165 [Kocuria tytonicola]RLZ03464.1 hypothetical protein CWC38_05605 [Kocuria tytonicola]
MTLLRPLATVVLPAALVLVTAVLTWVSGTVPREWAYPALLVAGSLSGDPVVRAVFSFADVSHERPQPATSPWTESEATAEPVDPPLRGGLVIGALERAAAIVSLLTGMVAGIGVVVAVKGLARYGEFTNARQREQFIIGTLVSLLWAALFAGAALWCTTPPGPFAG